MSERDVHLLAEKADMIVRGYAFFRRKDGYIGILNLEHPDCAMVVSRDAEMIETNMDEIEQAIVIELCRKNLQFMEAQDAEVLQG